MSDLGQIRDFAQSLAEAVSAALGVDATIIDDGAVRIAGTGRYKLLVGSRISRGYVLNKVLVEGNRYVVREPGRERACQSCEERHTCPEHACILTPVKIQEETIGALGLLALNPEQHAMLTSEGRNLVSFVDHICLLLADKVKGEREARLARDLADKLDAIVEAYPEALMVVDDKGRVTHFNRPAELMLEIAAESVLGRSLEEGPFSAQLAQAVRSGRSLTDVESAFEIDGRTVPVFLTTRPMGGGSSFLCTFRDLEAAKELAFDLTKRRARFAFDHIVGPSGPLRAAAERARQAAQGESPILLRGERGTGKDLFARAIHSASPRRNAPFVTVSCSAIPDELLEGELFGCEPGAFTGARRRPGVLELARGGTVFLEEVGKIPFGLQTRILRVLREKTMERVGGTASIPVDVRIIAATRRDLEAMTARGDFLEDLHRALNATCITVPPLRNRRDDILPLAEHFLAMYASLCQKKIVGLSAGTAAALLSYSWPGNVAELRCSIEHAVNMETSPLITPRSLPEGLFPGEDTASRIEFGKPLRTLALERQRDAIFQALKTYGSTTEGKKRAAKALGISLSTMYRRLQKIGQTQAWVPRTKLDER